MTTQQLAGKRIGFFGKGGSGKSTVAVLLAKTLHVRGYAVAVLDADSTNLGLAQTLGVPQNPRPLLDYYGGMVFEGGAVTCPVDDPTPLVGAAPVVDQLPNGYHMLSPDGIHLFVAGKMGDKGPGAGCDGPIAKIARDFRPTFSDETPVTLVDFKAGFEDSARGNVVSLDWIVVVVDPTVAAVQMAINMHEMVAQLHSGGMPATAHLKSPELVETARKMYHNANLGGVLCVLNRVPDAETERVLRHRLAQHGIEPVAVFPADPLLARAGLHGDPLPSIHCETALAQLIEALESAEDQRQTPSLIPNMTHIKVAAVTDQTGTKISAHFGRATHYVVATINDGQVTQRELRDKPSSHANGAKHNHNHDHHDHEDHARGHGKHSAEKHRNMLAPIADCQVLLARGMGQGAQQALLASGIRPILTDLSDLDAALNAVVDGTIVHRPERLH